MLTFDEKAKIWDSDERRNARIMEIAKSIKRNVPFTKNMTAFEYGCGTGTVALFLSPHLKHITLADSSTGMLEVLQEKIRTSDAKNMTPVYIDLMKDEAPKTQFDFVYTSLTLHHIIDTDRILKILNSLVADGGLFCVVDLDSEDGSFHGAGFDGHNGFDRDEFKVKLEKAGFSDISFKDCCVAEKETEGKLNKFSLFIMNCRK